MLSQQKDNKMQASPSFCRLHSTPSGSRLRYLRCKTNSDDEGTKAMTTEWTLVIPNPHVWVLWGVLWTPLNYKQKLRDVRGGGLPVLILNLWNLKHVNDAQTSACKAWQAWKIILKVTLCTSNGWHVRTKDLTSRVCGSLWGRRQIRPNINLFLHDGLHGIIALKHATVPVYGSMLVPYEKAYCSFNFHTFQEGLNGLVDAVLEMLQHQHDLVVTFVGDDCPDGTDL